MGEDSTEIKSSWAAVQDHTRHFSNFTFVYPVISRRSKGLSIGVNLNPDKICNFDCVYCEVDRYTPSAATEVNLRQMKNELTTMVQFARDGALAKEPKFDEVPWLTREVRDIAFSGDGEPTMIHNFAECVEAVVDVKQAEVLETTKIVLITDAAGLDKSDVKRGLEVMDHNNGEIWAKLDAGTEKYFELVNRTPVKFERILNNLLETSKLRPIIIQSLFFKLEGKAMSETEQEAYCRRLGDIADGGGQIREVHLYTVSRPTSETYAIRLEATELEEMAEMVRERTNLAVAVFP
ncbi:MAG: radical SAM protein [Verrucomicrobiota bacterium]|jgi:wyosine [tRNA(Phe)-imidazoG37] synthetase (radical SAM superfamily)|nr:radical SAM protein [Verrucomicrobiota bacterium]